MDAGYEMRRCMLTLDVEGVLELWRKTASHLPQPASEDTALAALHMARTGADSMPFSARAYSHAWLNERGMHSLLPDILKPRAQRLYPVIQSAVGVAVRSLTERGKPAARLIQAAMEDAVKEADADGKLEDSQHVKARMNEARRKAIVNIFG